MVDKKISEGSSPSLPLTGTELVAAAIPPSTNIKPTVLDVGRPAVLEHVAESDPHTQYLTELAAALAYQPLSANLTSYAGVAPTANALTLLGHTFAQMRSDLSLVVGTNVQAWSANLDSYATVAPSANVLSFLGAANYAAMRTQLGLVIGTNVQAYSANLDTFAANPLTSAELTQLQNINANTLGTTQWVALASATGNFGTAAYVATGQTGAAVPLCNGSAVTWAARPTFNGNTALDTGNGATLAGNNVFTGVFTVNNGALHAIGNGGTTSFVNSGFGLKINITGATAVLGVCRDGFAEVGLQSGGAGGVVGTFSNDNLTFYANNASRMVLGASGGLVIGSPTGGNKGAGTLNATAVYDDNVLLTCYVFDAALDGQIDFAKWDEKVVDREHPAKMEEVLNEKGEIISVKEIEPARTEERIHGPMRKFSERLGGEFDPLDIDAYTKHWQEKRHLTSMPNEEKFDPKESMATGAWIQRLIETVEIQAVHIAKLNERLKAGGL